MSIVLTRELLDDVIICIAARLTELEEHGYTAEDIKEAKRLKKLRASFVVERDMYEGNFKVEPDPQSAVPPVHKQTPEEFQARMDEIHGPSHDALGRSRDWSGRR